MPSLPPQEAALSAVMFLGPEHGTTRNSCPLLQTEVPSPQDMRHDPQPAAVGRASAPPPPGGGFLGHSSPGAQTQVRTVGDSQSAEEDGLSLSRIQEGCYRMLHERNSHNHVADFYKEITVL